MSDLSKMSDAEFAASLTKKACGCAGVGDHDLMEHLNEAARRLTAAGERNDTEWFRRRSESYAPLAEFKIVCDQRDAARAEVGRLVGTLAKIKGNHISDGHFCVVCGAEGGRYPCATYLDADAALSPAPPAAGGAK